MNKMERYIICITAAADHGKTHTANNVIKLLAASPNSSSIDIFDGRGNRVANAQNINTSKDYRAYAVINGKRVGVVTLGDPKSGQRKWLEWIATWKEGTGQKTPPDVIVCTARTSDTYASLNESPEEVVKSIARGDYCSGKVTYQIVWMNHVNVIHYSRCKALVTNAQLSNINDLSAQAIMHLI